MNTMKTLLALLTLGFSLSVASAQAADTADAPKAKTPQQLKMGECNKEAAGKKGEERKAFMKECLSAKAAAAPAAAASGAGTPQQEKMKACNAEAKDKNLKGAERKKHMSECLKK